MIVHLGTHACYGNDVYIEESLIEDIWWTCEGAENLNLPQKHSFVDHKGRQGKVPIAENPNEIMESIRKSKSERQDG